MPEYIIGFRIVSSSDTAALEKARATFAQLDAAQLKLVSSSKAGASAAGAMGQAWGQLKSLFLGLLGPVATLAALVMTLKKGFQEFAAETRSLRQVGAAAQQFGIDAGKARDKAKQLADALEMKGLDDAEVYAGLRDMIIVTKDLGAATTATSLAADIAKKKGWEYGEALNFLKLTIADSPRAYKTATKEFGISTRDNQKILAELQRQYQGYADTVTGVGSDIDRAKGAWKEFWKDVGASVAPVVPYVLKAFRAIAWGIDAAAGALLTAWITVKNIPADVADALAGRAEATRARHEKAAAEIEKIWDRRLAEWDAKVAGKGPSVGVVVGTPTPLKVTPSSDTISERQAAQAKALAEAHKATVAAINAEMEAEKQSGGVTGVTLEQKTKAHHRYVALLLSSLLEQQNALRDEEAEAVRLAEQEGQDTAAIHSTYATKRRELIRTVKRLEAESEADVTEYARMQAAERVRIASEEQATRGEMIAARIQALQTEAQQEGLSGERQAQIASQITALKAEALAIKLGNIEKARGLELDDLKAKGITDQGSIDSVNAKYDAQAKAADLAAAAEIQADNATVMARLLNLARMGEAQSAARKREYDETMAFLAAQRALYAKASADIDKAEENVRKQRLKAEREAAVSAVAMGIGALAAAFPKSKGLAIAQAIISTYEGANKALAQGGIWGAVAAAAIIAAGLANVARIRKVEPGSGAAGGQSASEAAGFDDPRNDRLMYMTGRKWAKDQAKFLEQGWNEGVVLENARARTRASSITDNRRTYTDNSRGPNITQNISVLWGPHARDAEAELARIVDRGLRGANRSRIAAGPQEIGG